MYLQLACAPADRALRDFALRMARSAFAHESLRAWSSGRPCHAKADFGFQTFKRWHLNPPPPCSSAALRLHKAAIAPPPPRAPLIVPADPDCEDDVNLAMSLYRLVTSGLIACPRLDSPVRASPSPDAPSAAFMERLLYGTPSPPYHPLHPMPLPSSAVAMSISPRDQFPGGTSGVDDDFMGGFTIPLPAPGPPRGAGPPLPVSPPGTVACHGAATPSPSPPPSPSPSPSPSSLALSLFLGRVSSVPSQSQGPSTMGMDCSGLPFERWMGGAMDISALGSSLVGLEVEGGVWT